MQRIVETVVREIIVNAVKANTKRLYFNKMGLNIDDIVQYNEGMKNFKSFMTNKKDYIFSELKSSTYKVMIVLKKSKTGIDVFVQNNVPLHPEELFRIQSRIEKARNYRSFSDVFDDELIDNIEGGGLGILLTIFSLKNSGIGESSFKISSDGKSTLSYLRIPYQLKPDKITSTIYSKILEDVNGLPTFPENILELQRLINDKNVDINTLAEKVSLDPSLSTSVLRIANSPLFITINRIENLHEAIKVIGLKNLNSILIASSARKILDERFSKFSEIWKHCNKVAFYAKEIARNIRRSEIIESVFLAAMLHDLGKIVLLSTNSNLIEWISKFSKTRELTTSTVVEEVALGISHTTIGELIAMKWNLPDYLVESIKLHHSPLNAGLVFKDIVFIVYLANMLCGIEENKYDYYFIEEDVLEHFDLNNEEKFNIFHDILKKKYSHASQFNS